MLSQSNTHTKKPGSYRRGARERPAPAEQVHCAQGRVSWLIPLFAVVFEHSSNLHRAPAYKEHTIHALIIRVTEALQIWTKTRLCVWGGQAGLCVCFAQSWISSKNRHIK